MKIRRYISSFLITLFIYLFIFLLIIYFFKDKELIIYNSKDTKKISLNSVELLYEKVEKDSIINKEPQEKQIEKSLNKNKITNKKVQIKPSNKQTTKTKKIEENISNSSNSDTIEQKSETSNIQSSNPKESEKIDDLDNHLLMIRELINQNINYPTRAKKLSIQGVVTVKFILLENGEVENITIIEGHKFFHISTIEAIEEASRKFPKMNKKIEIIVPIEYKLI